MFSPKTPQRTPSQRRSLAPSNNNSLFATPSVGYTRRTTFTPSIIATPGGVSYNRGPYTPAKRKIYESENHSIEICAQFPADVARQLQIRNAQEQVKGGVCDDTCWLLCGTHLFLWDHSQQDKAQSFEVPVCEDSTMVSFNIISSSDDDFDGESTTTAKNVQFDTNSIIAVTSEGNIRFWDMANRDSSRYIDASLNFRDSQCTAVTHVTHWKRNVFICADNRGNLYEIFTSNKAINTNCFSSQSSPLAGVVSWLRNSLGGRSSQEYSADNAVSSLNMFGNVLVVLRKKTIEQWISTSKMTWTSNIYDGINDHINTTLGDENAIHLLDAKYTSNGFFLLAVSVPLQQDNQSVASYHLYSFLQTTRSDALFTAPPPMHQLTHNILSYQPDIQDEDDLINNVTLYVAPKSKTVFVSWLNRLLIISAPYEDAVTTSVRLDNIIGGGLFDSALLLLTLNARIISASDNALGEGKSSLSMVPSKIRRLSLQPSVFVRDQDIDKEKALFLNEFQSYWELTQNTSDPHLHIDFMKLAQYLDISQCPPVSRFLIDSKPGSPVRWASDLRQIQQDDHTASMILLNQLEEKEKKYNTLLDFFYRLNFWEKLTVEERLGILEDGEKMRISVNLRKYHNQILLTKNGGTKVLSEAIRRCCEDRNLAPELCTPESFYHEVTRVPEILNCLLQLQKQKNKNSGNYNITLDVNEVFKTVFEAIQDFQESHNLLFPTAYNFTLWTTKQEIRDVIKGQMDEVVGVMKQGNINNTLLLPQLLSLAEFYLQSFKNQIASSDVQKGEINLLSLQERYKNAVHETVEIFARFDDLYSTVALAERFHDFNSLIQLCQANKLGEEKLLEYMYKFKSDGFLEDLFAFYQSEGQYSKLFDVPEDFNDKLQKYLKTDPNLLWIHAVRMGDMKLAATALSTVGDGSDVETKKTSLSLAKLALLTTVTDTDHSLSDGVRRIDNELSTVEIQERLNAMRATYGQEPITSSLSPTELVRQLCQLGIELAVFEPFDNAVALLQYKDPSFKPLLMLILRSAWEATPSWMDILQASKAGDYGLEQALRSTVFYQVLQSLKTQEILDKELFDNFAQTIVLGDHPDGARKLTSTAWSVLNQSSD